MPYATFLPPDLGSFCRLNELGPQVAGQRLEPGNLPEWACADLNCQLLLKF